MKNKEYGSDFYFTSDKKFLTKNSATNAFLGNEFSLFFSGRVALYNLLKEGIQNRNWNKVYIPSFYCHEVVHFIRDLPLEINYYEFNPFLDADDKKFFWDDVETTVIVNVLYFGIMKLDLKLYKNIVQIEDITHAILEYKNSEADYCFGSLRKELPIPVGGFCFSPQNNDLPIGMVDFKTEEISIEKLTAMFLKSKYIFEDWTDKQAFRKLFIDSENKFDLKFTNVAIPATSLIILTQLNVEEIIRTKAKNIALALTLLNNSNDFEYNLNLMKNNVFSLIIYCKTELLQFQLKRTLINNNVYPAVLWPNQITERDREVENRVLFIHLDYRYDCGEINYIINTLNKFKLNE